jgi:hypothetical protein
MRRLAATAALIAHSVMHGVGPLISAVVEFSSFEILMQLEFLTLHLQSERLHEMEIA